jgi:hypothetical protein
MFTNLNFTDVETCYKVFRKEVLDKIIIEENRFGFELEITAKISKIRPRLKSMKSVFHTMEELMKRRKENYLERWI